MFNFMRILQNEMMGSFSVDYKCYSVSMMPGQDRTDVEKGGKIILPPSALDRLTKLHIQYPMLFKLENKKENRVTHCGVLEFVADEGRVYLPYWMMNNLLLEEGSVVHVENVSLAVASYAKFQAQSIDFLDITNQKAVLENALRTFACLTSGDMIAINYNDRIYELKVLETKPNNAVSIIECDMNVDFAPPVGYEEPTKSSASHNDDEEQMDVDASQYTHQTVFKAFVGQGNRLDGKIKTCQNDSVTNEPVEIKRGIPNYNFKKGKITFIRTVKNTNGAIVSHCYI
ncbi:hypothetical protein HELRODRAFT_188513 [Helobdella robusta]|uniref:Ubiquitin fusion degradation protein 1 homolog n=1 Tax=Helobdella robusta TaxID=6412 RepID=T1FQ29_HELRO|nr:hypothetical protein HELRODRAFT_188513 [Helobdella robusta]ESO01896.1 hypothetical protein HELRODRAFT_188513 [Helobdella robusta]